MKYPKNKFMELGANFIGTAVLNGVYWINYVDEPNLDKEINRVKQSIIQVGEKVDNVLKVKKTDDATTLIFNKDIYQTVANEMFEKTYQANPKFPRRKNKIDLNKIRQSELEYFRDYIKTVKENRIDVYLYKMNGDRIKTIILEDSKNKTNYKKNIHGFYLTKEDITDLNGVLAQINKKIATIQENEMIDPHDGIRYTIELTQADYIS